MSNLRDYNAPTVGQAGCTYSRLGSIYSGQMAGAIPQDGSYLVPKYCPGGPGPNYPPKYNTLSHGQDYMCGGYFNVTGAYPYADCTSCKTGFVSRPCKSTIDCQTVEGYKKESGWYN